MTSTHRRYLAVEAAIGGAINAVLSLAFGLLVFGGRPAAPVWGGGGLVVDAAPQSFMVALMSILVPTLLTRSRLRRGRVAPLARAAPARPPRPVLRAVAAAAAVALVAVGAQAALLALGPPAWPVPATLAAKALYGAALGGAISFLAVRSALCHAPPARSAPCPK